MSFEKKVIIAMWSGPRNISTAMMRSFENRKDTLVTDEPFYAYYLNETGLMHPCRDEILKSQSTNWNTIVKNLNKKLPKGKMIHYQKHMAHHISYEDDITWLKNFKNCFLIRHPKEVIISYAKKNKIRNSIELGYVHQVELFNAVKKISGSTPIVIDSRDILLEPEFYLQRLCESFNINFSNKMLKWPRGVRDTDGVWSRHWYNNVINSSGFIPYKEPKEDVAKEDVKFYEHSIDLYNYLRSFKI